MKAAFLIVGIIIIIALYVVPVPVIPQPQPQYCPSFISTCPSTAVTPQQYFLPIADLSKSVDDPLLVGGLYGVLIGGVQYELYRGLFYLGWLIGVICVILGLTR